MLYHLSKYSKVNTPHHNLSIIINICFLGFAGISLFIKSHILEFIISSIL